MQTISFSLIFTRSYPPVQNLGDGHSNTIELTSWLVHVLCGLKATWHQEPYFIVSWIHHGSTSSCEAYILPFWWKSFIHISIIAWVAIYIFVFVIHFTKSKLKIISVQVLKLPEKNILFPLQGIYLLLRNHISAENIGIKVSHY